ncbi:MAG: TRAP transporter large permease subunit [Planctomycetes bacterium]|nr:TRAP transporter large permease subunit [Planctomycetota bacterium]
MTTAAAGPAAARPRVLRVVRGLENLVLALSLAAIAILPVAEMLLRSAGAAGIPGASTITQHLVLVVGMAGGAIAARERRMLALSTVENFLTGRWRSGAHLVTLALASGVAAWLAVAGWMFVADEREFPRDLAWGVPLWVVQLAIPAGFGLVAARLAWSAAETLRGRFLALSIAAGVIALGAFGPADPAGLVTPALVLLGLATLLGAPIFVTLGGAALILFWGAGEPIASIPIDHYRLVTNPSLASIPLFTLAGYFLAEGGASRRLLALFQAAFAGFRGGPALVTVLVCAFFTTFTGASGVTVLALGGLLLPILLSSGYRERPALGLVTGASSLGMLFPPCLPIVLYAIVAQQPMGDMFLGGLLPGCVLVAVTVAWGVRAGPPAGPRAPLDLARARRAAWDAKWELMLPVVAVGALFSGFATPVEAAGITALFAGFTQVVVHRDIAPVRGVARVLGECGLVIGGVLLILGVALAFTNWLVTADVPSVLLEGVTARVESKWAFLLLLNLFLLLVGCLMDVYSAIVVVVPLVVPLGEHYGIHPIHLGIVFLANLELGYLTPPVGMNLFLASYRLGKPLVEVYRAVLPVLVVLIVGVLAITYLPALSTWLPELLGSSR